MLLGVIPVSGFWGRLCTGSANPKDWGTLPGRPKVTTSDVPPPQKTAAISEGSAPADPAESDPKVSEKLAKMKPGNHVRLTTSSGWVVIGTLTAVSKDGVMTIAQDSGDSVSVEPMLVRTAKITAQH